MNVNIWKSLHPLRWNEKTSSLAKVAQLQPAEVDKQSLTTWTARKIWGEAHTGKKESCKDLLREWLENEKNITLSKKEKQINASEL